jgi:prevent-host-death family protein
MVEVTSKEAKDRFGAVMDTAQREPVTVTKHNRPSVVIISAERYAELEALEDQAWAAKAQEAEKNGYLDAADSEEFIKGILNAEA